MGCGGSSGSEKKIDFKKTKLKDIDEVFDDGQAIVDQVYAIQDPIEDNRENLLRSTKVWDLKCGNTQHATVGLVMAIGALGDGGKVDDAVKVTGESPFIEINDKSVAGGLKQSAEDLKAYIEAVTSAPEKIPDLADKAKVLAEKGPDMPDKAKKGLESAGDLSAMDK